MPKYHWFPFFDDDIAGSRFCCRPGLERFHDREIRLVREKRVSPAAAKQHDDVSPLELVSRALQKLGRGRSP
jgi:hypothetical protein